MAGTLRCRGDNFRITIQLRDAQQSVILWAKLFDLANDLPHESDSLVQNVSLQIGDIFGVIGNHVWTVARNKPLGEFTAVESVLKAFQYHCSLADELYDDTVKTMERAVRLHPDFAWGWAALAHLYLDAAGYFAKPGPFDASEQSQECIKRALRIDPNCAYTHWTLGLYHLLHNQIEKACESAEKTINHTLGDPFETAAAGALLSVAGHPETGESHVQRALNRNPRLPGWVCWSAAIHQIGTGNYEEALTTTESFSLPQCFWDPLLRGIALVHSGQKHAAQQALQRARELRPQLAERPRELVSTIVKQPDTLKQILDCLAE